MRKLCIRGMWGVMCVVGFGVVGCNGGSGGGYDSAASYSSPSTSSYKSAELTLEEKERQRPAKFLRTDGTFRKNLIGEYVIEGTISSSARVAVYKDVQLQVDFYSKTRTVIASDVYTVYEYVGPGGSVGFKLKVTGYRGTSSLGWEVVGAGVE